MVERVEIAAAVGLASMPQRGQPTGNKGGGG
jgi:hypothetical protein